MRGHDPLSPEPRDPGQQFWDPEIQTADPEQRRAQQEASLQAMMARIGAGHSPFFARKLKDAGIAPADVRTLEDLYDVPTTIKQEIRESEAAHPPFGDYRFLDSPPPVRVGQSTGSTGKPTLMTWTKHDLWVEHESKCRDLWRRGIRPGMVATHAHPGYLYGGGILLTTGYEYFGLCVIWAPPPATDEDARKAIEMWQRVTPDLPFVGFTLNRFAEVAYEMGLDLHDDVGVPRPVVSKNPHIPLLTAGLDCYAGLGSVCTADAGAHINEDRAIVQSIDPDTGREVADGEWGNMVVTTLDRDNGLLRWDMEEACALYREPCSCGDTLIRGYWGGRFKDVLKVQGKRLIFTEVEHGLRTVGSLTVPSLEFVIVRPRGDSEPLRVRVEAGGAGEPQDSQAIAATVALQTTLDLKVEVEIVPRGSLPRSDFKAARVVDA
jgi:phenylacetate-CoA ligase